MAKIFTDGSPQDYQRLTRIMRLHHTDLADNEVKICLTFVQQLDREDNPVPALKFSGHNAAGMAKLISKEKQLRIDFEAEIKIDKMVWDDLDDTAQDALLDHELCHIGFKKDAHGIIIQDEDTHRPILKLIPDDFMITGFFSVIRHYGEAAGEYRSVKSAMESAAAQLADMVTNAEAA